MSCILIVRKQETNMEKKINKKIFLQKKLVKKYFLPWNENAASRSYLTFKEAEQINKIIKEPKRALKYICLELLSQYKTELILEEDLIEELPVNGVLQTIESPWNETDNK